MEDELIKIPQGRRILLGVRLLFFDLRSLRQFLLVARIDSFNFGLIHIKGLENLRLELLVIVLDHFSLLEGFL